MSFERYMFNSACNSALSNFHTVQGKLTVWGIKFDSSEQCYQYFKALFHGKQQLCTKILKQHSALKCYKLGKSIVTSQLWRQEKVDVMFHILMHKLYQCTEFRQELLQNQCKVFTENTKNRFWGIGHSGEGLNTLGVLLHKVVLAWELDHL